MSITAKQLATMLELSESAISLALNNRPGVSSDTRRRVFEAAHKYGYDFSRKKRDSDDCRKGKICLAIYKKSGAVVGDTPFFSSLLDGISVSCRREGYRHVIKYLYENGVLEKQIYDIGSSDFSGLIVLATEISEITLKQFDVLKMPLLFLDAYFDTADYNFVLINNIQGSFMATQYLIQQRHAQPGYLRSSYSISNFEQRADGFYKAIRANGMSSSQSSVLHLTPSQEGAYFDMKMLLNDGEKPANCYFADNDLIAMGAIQALQENGYKIPEDVAVVGFDDMPACEYITPALTTVSVPKQFMGEIAVTRIVQLIEGKNVQPLKIEVFAKLIKRKSV